MFLSNTRLDHVIFFILLSVIRIWIWRLASRTFYKTIYKPGWQHLNTVFNAGTIQDSNSGCGSKSEIFLFKFRSWRKMKLEESFLLGLNLFLKIKNHLEPAWSYFTLLLFLSISSNECVALSKKTNIFDKILMKWMARTLMLNSFYATLRVSVFIYFSSVQVCLVSGPNQLPSRFRHLFEDEAALRWTKLVANK